MEPSSQKPPIPAPTAETATAGKGKNTTLFILIGVVVLALVGAGLFFALRGDGLFKKPDDETTISLNKSLYEPGEQMTITYEIVEDIDDTAWIGIIPADTEHGREEDADAVDISYQYFYGEKSGTITMYAPDDEGEYDVRIYDSDSVTGKELAYKTFFVEASESELENSVELDSDEYEPGETIYVYYTTDGTFEDFAWVGIIPSNIAHGDEGLNDQHDIEYQYIEGTSGTVTLTAPDEPGEYDVRMHNGDWEGAEEVAYASFTVVED